MQMKWETIAVVPMREDGGLEAGLLCAIVLFLYSSPIGGAILIDCKVNSSLQSCTMKNCKTVYDDPSWSGMVVVEKERLGRINTQREQNKLSFLIIGTFVERNGRIHIDRYWWYFLILDCFYTFFFYIHYCCEQQSNFLNSFIKMAFKYSGSPGLIFALWI